MEYAKFSLPVNRLPTHRTAGCLLVLLLLLALRHAGAIEILTNGVISYNTSAPATDPDQIPNWDTGWPVQGLTGWNYTGTVNTCSAVYLGNDWVITAGDANSAIQNPGNFLLDGTSYAAVAGSEVGIIDPEDNQVDITLFRLATSPGLPPMPLSFSDPVPLSDSQPGDLVAMIGYLRGSGTMSWGLDTVTANNIDVGLMGYPYVSNSFEAAYGTTTSPSAINSATNYATLIPGDSGGGDFIFNSSIDQWELAGLNEGVDASTNDSYMVQIDTYATQIDQISGVPEPPSSVLAFLSLSLFFLPCLRRSARDLFPNPSSRSPSLPPP